LTIKEVKAGLNALLASKYPDIKLYSKAVVEGYKRPCFFTQLQPITMGNRTRTTRYNLVSFHIEYIQEELDEADILDKVQEIRELFGLYVKIDDRAIDVVDFDFDYVGTDRNILELSLELEWLDEIKHESNEETMVSLVFSKEMEEK
jgi:hypothetical protein